MQKYIDAAFSSRPVMPLKGAEVTVTTSNGDLATLYSDNAGTLMGNPIYTDDGGNYSFYAADGRYTITIKKTGFQTQILADVLLEDQADGSAALASSVGASLVGYVQSGTASVKRTVQDKLRDQVNVFDFGAAGNGTTDDTLAVSATTDLKVGATSNYSVPIGSFPITAQQSLSAYYNICGHGDSSQIKISTGTGFAYTAQTGVFDDHPHTFLEKLRVTGDGTFAAYPNAQSGTTTGHSFATVDNIGNFASSYGITYELHGIGKYVKKSFVHTGEYNHFRANKVGLQLEEVTSYTETNSYFRYNSDAAVKIIGGQNVTIRGGAIEGNPGSAIKYVAGASTWGQINIDNVYFESNGSETGGIWSIDIPSGSPVMTNIRGGNLWRNTASGITSGPYRLGDNAVIDGTTLSGGMYVKYARVRNTRGFPAWNTFASEVVARLFGLTEPTVMLEYSPAIQEYDFSGATGGMVFCTPMQGRGSAKIPGITNLASTVYPYGYVASSGASAAANSSLNYGEGDFFRATFAASVGNFSSNYVTLQNFTDTSKPYRVTCSIFYPEADCEIAIVQSIGGQSIFANFALKANTYYRMVMCGFTPMTAGSFLRIYPINASAPVINFLPIWASQHATHKEQLLVLGKLVRGEV